MVHQGLSLKEANALVLALLAKYEHVFSLPGGNPGVRFDQAYELPSLRPTLAWQDLNRGVKSDVRVIGLGLLI